jgi:hypothetical protein
MKTKIRSFILFIIFSLLTFSLVYGISDIKIGKVGQPVYTLTVTGSGTGSGVVTSNLYGINCVSTAGVETGVCSAQIPMGTTVILTPTPDGGNMFNGWTGGGCSGVGTCSVLINGDKIIDANFLNIPTTSMWAWFKHNEGSGTVIIDYSPVATNGALNQSGGAAPTGAQQNYFWNTNPGFGTESSANQGAKTIRTAPPANTTYISLVAFVKPLGNGVFNSYQAVQLGEGGGHFLQIGWEGASAPHFWKFTLPTGTYTSTQAATYGTWYCIYAFSRRNTTNTGMYVRKSGDANWTLARSGDASGAVAVIQNGVYMFGGTNNPISMVGGDGLYYADLASTGIISLTDATNIYNSLKARYGML